MSAYLLSAPSALAQEDQEEVQSGRAIGKVSTAGDLVVVELNEGALGNAHLFDLTGRTLRFTPDGSRFRVESGALNWDANFGPELAGAEVTLQRFAFPFSGKRWNSFLVGKTGTIRFGTPQKEDSPDFGGQSDGGVSIGRFDSLADAAGRLMDSAPALCVFLKPRMSGPHYVKQLADRVVITWNLTEPFGNIQDFTWFKTVNRFQAVLHRDGSIEMSYKELAAKDAIVGVYPLLSGSEKPLATLSAQPSTDIAAHIDVRSVRLSVIDGILLKVTFETRGAVLREGDPAVPDIAYRVLFDAHAPTEPTRTFSWTIRGVSPDGHPSRYVAFGAGASRKVTVTGNAISMQGVLPPTLRGIHQIAISAEVQRSGPDEQIIERIAAQPVNFSGIPIAELHLSSLSHKDGPFPLIYESFHYLALPRPQDLSCTVIQGLGDKFDFLAYYSDFRIDNQEAGTPSDGPVAGNVTGVGQKQHDMENYCSRGKFQWEYVQPVYVGSNQMQEWPPENAPVGGTHDITFYSQQLAESAPAGKMRPFNYAMSQLGHEMGHRWAAFVSAKVNGENIPLGPVHWAKGLQAPVAFPYQRPSEASAMGGSVWQDNFDGTYTQLDDDYYVPATGFSHLDLYLMGLISPAEVPDFFILKNIVPSGRDRNGHPVFKAERTKVTIHDVIAVEGPRLPDVDHSQRKFNTGIVLVVEHGKEPSKELMERANAIRTRWIDYWETVTGHRASMTANP